MGCYWSSVVSGDLVLKEHEAARWLGKDELMDVEWLPADVDYGLGYFDLFLLDLLIE